ncbi:putative zinc metalloproteinase YIL108W [Coccinella septempunctata]|uniref:putative zinc metalloproteinase YIL108W n=1 Tax=Coccinella septempunctata TaxID=41139 RepID=UPI001D07C9FD|nr:putative zinc metalloproteinase YIL108W [Coccinella septempunctata]
MRLCVSKGDGSVETASFKRGNSANIRFSCVRELKMTHPKHITIDNFSDGEIISYQLIILKGTIHKDSNGKSDENNIFLQHLDNQFFHNSQSYQFKFILSLREGPNNITIKYCCHEVQISLQYVPRILTYTVCPLYIICKGHDGRFQAPENQNNSKESACKRIMLISKMLQCVTAEKLYEKTLNRKTFVLEEECQIFYSELCYLDAVKMEEKQLWEYFGREIMRSALGTARRKYLGFLSCTRYCSEKYDESFVSHSDLINITDAYVALGGGGLALFGSASLYTWPENMEDIVKCFEDQTPVDKTKFLDDSGYRGTLGACFSTSLGSVLHELGHTFDLGHTKSGIMARGFDNIYKVFTPHSEDDRKISTNFHKTIEFRENFEPKLLSERLKNMPKEFQVTGSTKTERDADDTFWTKSCATILSNHRWFNNFSEDSTYVLKYDDNSKVFLSTAGLRVIELRRNSDEMVLKDWVFNGKILKYSFPVPLDPNADDSLDSIVFAEDNVGNILKLKY